MSYIPPLTLSTAPFRLTSSIDGVNASLVKASSGTLFGAVCYNTSSLPRYIKFYNKATAPTVGTDVPMASYYINPQDSFDIPLPAPMLFSTGISVAFTSFSSDSDSTAIGAGEIMGLNVYFQ